MADLEVLRHEFGLKNIIKNPEDVWRTKLNLLTWTHNTSERMYQYLVTGVFLRFENSEIFACENTE